MRNLVLLFCIYMMAAVAACTNTKTTSSEVSHNEKDSSTQSVILLINYPGQKAQIISCSDSMIYVGVGSIGVFDLDSVPLSKDLYFDLDTVLLSKDLDFDLDTVPLSLDSDFDLDSVHLSKDLYFDLDTVPLSLDSDFDLDSVHLSLDWDKDRVVSRKLNKTDIRILSNISSRLKTIEYFDNRVVKDGVEFYVYLNNKRKVCCYKAHLDHIPKEISEIIIQIINIASPLYEVNYGN